MSFVKKQQAENFPSAWQEIGRAKSVSIVLNDILVTINGADCSFNNPVPLTTENSVSSTIGYAQLLHRSDRIYATLHIEDETKPYTEFYPQVEVDKGSKKITAIKLSPNPNEDVRIERIMDQELFQSSPGAENAEMQ